MPDIRNQRPRPGVRIYLHPADLAEIFRQPDVIASFTEEELKQSAECINLELNYREKQNDNSNS